MGRPSRLQYFIASRWPMILCLAGFPVAFATFIASSYIQTFDASSGVLWGLKLVYLVVLALLLGFFSAVVFVAFFLSVVFYHCGLWNGGPFRVGDRVRILSGRFRDRVVRVVGECQFDTLRVDLGSEPCAANEDVFVPARLFREPESDESRD